MLSIRSFFLVSALAVTSGAAAQPAALGLTKAQLEDADLIDANGVDVGDVEYAITDGSGQIVALAIEVDRREPLPDKLVKLPLDGLRAMPERGDPGDFNVVTPMSAKDVVALPVAQ